MKHPSADQLKVQFQNIYDKWRTQDPLTFTDSKSITRTYGQWRVTMRVEFIRVDSRKHTNTPKLTADQVREIRSSELSNGALARRFNVSRYAISDARRRITYKHVLD